MTHDTPPKRIWAIEYRGEAVPRSGEWVAEQSDAPEGANSYTLTSHAEAMVAAALREAAEGLLDWYTNVEDDRGPHMVVLALIPQTASAALDRAILEAKTEVAAILGVAATRDTMTGEPVMWGDEDGDCLTPEIAVQCALDKLIAEAVQAERERSISIAASLAAAISLLERGGKAAKKAAPSDKMFDQMLVDYRTSLEAWRAANGDPT